MDNMREKLKSLLSIEGKTIDEPCEQIFFNSILPYQIKYKKMEVILYGIGGKAFHCLNWLRSAGIEPICITDKKELLDSSVFFGIPQIPINEISNYINGHEICALLCDASLKYEYDLDKARKLLYNAGVSCIYDIKFLNSVYYYEWKYYLCKYSDDFIESFSLFKEQLSKEIFIEYIRCIMENDFYRLDNEHTFRKYFGDGIFNWKKDECFISCGAYLGDTIFHLIDKYPFEHIYGIEANKNYFDGMVEYLKVLPPEIYNKIDLFCTELGSRGNSALDTLLQNRKVTLISLDVEGAEIDVLRGTKEIIQNQRPILALSTYHKKDDLVTLPKIVNQYVNNYSFFLRKYYFGGLMNSKDECVLYAVPNERVAK
jgi:CheY-like chemotaxis protein